MDTLRDKKKKKKKVGRTYRRERRQVNSRHEVAGAMSNESHVGEDPDLPTFETDSSTELNFSSRGVAAFIAAMREVQKNTEFSKLPLYSSGPTPADGAMFDEGDVDEDPDLASFETDSPTTSNFSNRGVAGIIPAMNEMQIDTEFPKVPLHSRDSKPTDAELNKPFKITSGEKKRSGGYIFFEVDSGSSSSDEAWELPMEHDYLRNWVHAPGICTARPPLQGTCPFGNTYTSDLTTQFKQSDKKKIEDYVVLEVDSNSSALDKAVEVPLEQDYLRNWVQAPGICKNPTALQGACGFENAFGSDLSNQFNQSDSKRMSTKITMTDDYIVFEVDPGTSYNDKSAEVPLEQDHLRNSVQMPGICTARSAMQGTCPFGNSFASELMNQFKQSDSLRMSTQITKVDDCVVFEPAPCTSSNDEAMEVSLEQHHTRKSVRTPGICRAHSAMQAAYTFENTFDCCPRAIKRARSEHSPMTKATLKKNLQSGPPVVGIVPTTPRIRDEKKFQMNELKRFGTLRLSNALEHPRFKNARPAEKLVNELRIFYDPYYCFTYHYEDKKQMWKIFKITPWTCSEDVALQVHRKQDPRIPVLVSGIRSACTPFQGACTVENTVVSEVQNRIKWFDSLGLRIKKNEAYGYIIFKEGGSIGKFFVQNPTTGVYNDIITHQYDKYQRMWNVMMMNPWKCFDDVASQVHEKIHLQNSMPVSWNRSAMTAIQIASSLENLLR